MRQNGFKERNDSMSPAQMVERALDLFPPRPGEGPFESRAFYELCQHYRTRPLVPIPDVVDAFEALKLFGARFISDGASGWREISLDWLPGFDDDRQFVVRNSAGYCACVTALFRRADGVVGGEDATPEETRCVISDVTHWMPLPEAP